MLQMPSKRAIVAEERGLLERQRVFRCAADRITAALAQCRSVEAIALIGSVARPLRREVPRFAPYRQLRVAIAHECKDVDLAVWVSRLDGLDDLRRARGRAIGEIVAERGHGPAIQEIEVFLLEPGTNRYLGRLCYLGRKKLWGERRKPARSYDDLPVLPDALKQQLSSLLSTAASLECDYQSALDAAGTPAAVSALPVLNRLHAEWEGDRARFSAALPGAGVPQKSSDLVLPLLDRMAQQIGRLKPTSRRRDTPAGGERTAAGEPGAVVGRDVGGEFPGARGGPLSLHRPMRGPRPCS